MSIADEVKGKSRPVGKAGGVSSDLSLALNEQVQAQVDSMVNAANVAHMSIEYASDQLAGYFSDVLSGRNLLERTMQKVQERIKEEGSVTIESETVNPVVNLPRLSFRGFSFRSLFSAGSPDNPFLLGGSEEGDG